MYIADICAVASRLKVMRMYITTQNKIVYQYMRVKLLDPCTHREVCSPPSCNPYTTQQLSDGVQTEHKQFIEMCVRV